MPSRVAVIGAGAAGLVAARELRREGHAPVVFERATGVGGTWLYDPSASSDPLSAGGSYSSLYASLRTNLPREIMGFLDFPFVAVEGADSDQRRFPGHEEVLRYLQEFARRFDLLGMVRLGTEVVRVHRDASAASWRVAYSSRKLAGVGGEEVEVGEEAFDAVVVCSGHFTEPRLAHIAGIDSWPGKQLHSYNYRVPDPFHGQVVVIIGYHPSGIDISRELAGVAKEVHVAIRSAPCEMQTTPTTDRSNLWLHSMIERAEEDGTIVFQDGSRIKADAIVHCTGYKYNFPFIGDDVGTYVEDNCVRPLYKHVFPPQLAPHVSFIGLPFSSILFPLFQLQSTWVARVLSGRIELPSQDNMMHDVAAFYADMEARGCPKRSTHDLRCTFEYEDWLVEQCGMEKIEEWRKLIYVMARTTAPDRHESYRDEWEDNHLLAQAHRDFTKYL
ncbi:flavin-containing monooxygenase FMO GS-OX5-like [Lolium rigidum]|uniref:flavin-containing monooxygenase FMO GS-OX5-like n=1 Tax=Lolium rigidum TaxID=89674 RepID=UPI001F5CC355|nr:flavin-containing monooxygenase FMO GS-OX5-like [Lolium rigidum]